MLKIPKRTGNARARARVVSTLRIEIMHAYKQSGVFNKKFAMFIIHYINEPRVQNVSSNYISRDRK